MHGETFYDKISEQDYLLAEMGQSVDRQIHLAREIGKEVSEQNDLLDKLGCDVTKTTGKVEKRTSDVEDLNKKQNNCSTWVLGMIIVGLVVCLILVIVL